jgi:1,2-diacylglycerol 3-beta-glucosyltransferase
MMIFTVIIAVITLFYCTLSLLLRLGLSRPPKAGEEINSPITGSLVICGRNEEDALPDCLASIASQSIEVDRLQVILVDDGSTDGTGKIMDEFVTSCRFKGRVLHMPPPFPGERMGKWRALKEGIKLAENDALLLTDADAILPPQWAERHLQKLQQFEISGGVALLEGENWWAKVQALDWFFLLGIGSAWTGLGKPQAALGKNLCFRQAAYEAVGGLEAIGFTLTEDRAMVQTMTRKGARLSFSLDPNLMVSTEALPDWGHYASQRMRWASGIRWLDCWGKLSIFATALRNFAIVIGILLGHPAAWIAWMVTAVCNLLLLQSITRKLKQIGKLKSFLSWEIFSTFSTLYLSLQWLFRRPVSWKGRKYGGKVDQV